MPAGQEYRVRTSRGYERLNAFADAVVAIAMTLLILPLAEIPFRRHGSVGSLLADHFGQIFAFGLSFAVIARFWIAHHHISEHVRNYSQPLLVWTMIWLLTIVFLPFPTELIGQGPATRTSAALYIATLLASSISLGTLTWLGLRNDELRHPGTSPQETVRLTTAAWRNPALLTIALILAVAFPSLGLYPLLLLLLEPTVARLARRWISHPG